MSNDSYWKLESETLSIDYDAGATVSEDKLLGIYNTRPTYEQLESKINDSVVCHTLMVSDEFIPESKWLTSYSLTQCKFD